MAVRPYKHAVVCQLDHWKRGLKTNSRYSYIFAFMCRERGHLTNRHSGSPNYSLTGSLFQHKF
jgi:hypothetical protein